MGTHKWLSDITSSFNQPEKKNKKKKVDAEKDLYLVLYLSWPWLKPFSVSLNKQLLNWKRDFNFCLKYIHLEQIAYITFLLP